MFDYFYGNETEQYHYYSVPKLLFTDDKFKGLSCQAKLLYGFLLDRTALSVENKWFDKQGRTYVYYKQSDAQNNLNIGKNKATAIFTELENIGLIIRQKQGQGKPTKIFVMNFTKFIGKQRDTASKENGKAISQTPENRESENAGRESRLPKTGSLNSTKEGVKTPKNREHNKPEINKPNGRYIYPSISLHNTDNRESDRDSDVRIDGNPQNSEILIYQNAIAEVKLQIEYMYLIENHQHESAFLDLIVNLMAEVYGLAKTNPSSSVPINGINKSIELVADQLKKIDSEHIEYLIDKIGSLAKTKRIKNSRNYFLSCLYNAPTTMELDTDLQVAYDLHNSR